MMTCLEKTELTLIFIIAAVIAYFGELLPLSIPLGQVLLNVSLLLFI